MSMSAQMLAEWTALSVVHAALQTVQRSLEDRPDGRAAHRHHLQRLHDHTKGLHEFAVRLHRKHEAE